MALSRIVDPAADGYNGRPSSAEVTIKRAAVHPNPRTSMEVAHDNAFGFPSHYRPHRLKSLLLVAKASFTPARAPDELIVVKSTKKPPEAVADSIKAYAEKNTWVYLGANKIAPGRVTLVKIRITIRPSSSPRNACTSDDIIQRRSCRLQASCDDRERVARTTAKAASARTRGGMRLSPLQQPARPRP